MLIDFISNFSLRPEVGMETLVLEVSIPIPPTQKNFRRVRKGYGP